MSTSSADLSKWVDHPVWVLTTDGRTLVGELKGFDQTTNIILAKTHERLYSSTEPMVSQPLGVYLIRGDNVCIIGELDEELDAAADYENVRADPIDPLKL